jgi:toxin ParE1/3/4
MPHIELAPGVLDDVDRFLDHQVLHGIEDSPQRIADLIEGIQVLSHSPLIGRKTRAGMREMVIGRGSRGYVVLYQYVSTVDTVFVLAIRSQRESGFKRNT